jgi:hypothetical protein
MVCATARLHDHLGTLQFAEESLHLSPPEVAPKHWTICVIHAVQRESVL